MFFFFFAIHYGVDTLSWSDDSCFWSFKSTESTPNSGLQKWLHFNVSHKLQKLLWQQSKEKPKYQFINRQASIRDKDLCTHSLDGWLIKDQSFSNDVCSHLHSGALCYLNYIYPVWGFDSCLCEWVFFIPRPQWYCTHTLWRMYNRYVCLKTLL